MTEPRGADAAAARVSGGPTAGPTPAGAPAGAPAGPAAASSTRAARSSTPDEPPTTVLPTGPGRAGAPGGSSPTPRPAPARTVPPRPVRSSEPRPASSRGALTAGKSRRARLSLRRIDPWSVFVFTLVASIFVGIALVVAVAALFSVLGSIGVTASVNQLFAEVTGGLSSSGPLITFNRVVGGAAVLAALNIVFLTLLATLSALLYNLCASFTGGIELTLGEND